MVVCFDLSGGSLKDWLKGLAFTYLTPNSPKAELVTQWACAEDIKRQYISYYCLRQVETAKESKRQTKKPGGKV